MRPAKTQMTSLFRFLKVWGRSFVKVVRQHFELVHVMGLKWLFGNRWFLGGENTRKNSFFRKQKSLT